MAKFSRQPEALSQQVAQPTFWGRLLSAVGMGGVGLGGNTSGTAANRQSSSGGKSIWRGARHDERAMRTFNPPQRHGETEVRASWQTLGARAREVVENDPQIKRPSASMNRLCVGSGLQLYAMAMTQTKGSGGKPKLDLDEAFNIPADLAWQQWCVDDHFADDQQMLFKEWSDQGNGIAFSYNEDNGRPAVQIIEFEQLDKTLDRPSERGQNEISNGIEYFKGKPVAYHLLEAHPQDGFGGLKGAKSQRIPADRIDHLYCPTRASMRTGVSWWQCAMRFAFEGDFLFGEELTSWAVANLFTLAIKRANWQEGDILDLKDGDARNPAEDGKGNPLIRMAAGNVQLLDPEDEIVPINSNRPSKNIGDVMRLIWLLCSQGNNLSYHRSTGDMNGASYTSLRAAMLDDAMMTGPLQEYFGRRFVAKQRRRVDAWHVATRAIPISAAKYRSRSVMYRNYLAIGPGQAWLQPDQEIEASRMAIGGGLSSLIRECGSKGIYWLQNIREQALVNSMCERYGVKHDYSKGNGGQQTANSTDVRSKPLEKPSAEKAGTAKPATKKRGAA